MTTEGYAYAFAQHVYAILPCVAIQAMPGAVQIAWPTFWPRKSTTPGAAFDICRENIIMTVVIGDNLPEPRQAAEQIAKDLQRRHLDIVTGRLSVDSAETFATIWYPSESTAN